MFNPFKRNRPQQPFLSPLGRHRRLPDAAAPLAVTAVGGIVLVVAFGTLFGGLAGGPSPDPAAPPPVPMARQAAPRSVEPPAAVAAVPDAASPTATDSARAALTAPPTYVPDPASTAAIILEPILPPAATDVPVAESDADIAALEAIQHDAVAGDLGTAAPTPDAPATAQAATPALREARVRQAVNLRAAPDNDGRVLTVVPAGAAVEAEDDCRWCAVRYRGSSGFVYKTFLDYR